MKKAVCFCLIALAAVFMMSSVVSAEEKAEPRLITVTGEAEVLVAPDEAVLMLGVETTTKDLSAAKAENDKNTKKILEAVKKLNVPDKDIQTDRFLGKTVFIGESQVVFRIQALSPVKRICVRE